MGNVHLSALLCLLTLTAAPAKALPPELTALQRSLQRTQSLTARFHQSRRWTALKDVLESDGRLQYTRGGALVWRTEHPAESELRLEGNRAVMSYPALKTEQTIDFSTDPGMGKVFETIRAVLQADLGVLQPLFELTVVRSTPLSLTLTPRTPELQRMLRSIRLEFNAQSLLTHVVLTEPSQDTTDLLFSQQDVQRSAG